VFKVVSETVGSDTTGVPANTVIHIDNTIKIFVIIFLLLLKIVLRGAQY